MKRILMMLCLIIVLTGCSSNSIDDKADKLINNYFQEHLKDPSSYECIERGNLGKYTPMTMALEKFNKKVENGEASIDTLDSFLSNIKTYFESSGTDPYEILAWELRVKYRAKNSFGGYTINSSTFYFDEEITTITNIKSE